jgi:hypothetical protein
VRRLLRGLVKGRDQGIPHIGRHALRPGDAGGIVEHHLEALLANGRYAGVARQPFLTALDSMEGVKISGMVDLRMRKPKRPCSPATERQG